MTRPLRGAILGFGAVAERGHLPAWKDDPRFEIVAVAEPRNERRAAAARALPEARVYGAILELLKVERLDFVDVASPPLFHGDAIVAAAKSGLHVLCEKPLVTSRDAFAIVTGAASAAGVVLHPVHNWKHADAYQLLTRIVKPPFARPCGLRAVAGGERQAACAVGHADASPCIGELREIHFQIERDGWSMSAADWRASRRIAGGGILVDHGWHTFYLAQGLARRRPQVVRATIEKRRYRDADVEDSARCAIDFGDCSATIDLSWAGSVRSTAWAVHGDAGSVEIRDAALHARCGVEQTVRNLATSLSHGSHHPEWFPGVLASFAAAIADPAAARDGLLEAAWCVSLLEAAYASAAAGGTPVAVVAPAP